MTLEESREVIPIMESMINQIEEQQNLMAEMVQELQERDRQLLSFQEQNQSLQILNSELSGLLNLLNIAARFCRFWLCIGNSRCSASSH